MVPKRVLSAAAGALALALALGVCDSDMWDTLIHGPRGGEGTEVTISNGRFVIAAKGNSCFAAPWGEWAEWDEEGEENIPKEIFHYKYDEERVLDYTKRDKEAQRLYSWHLIDPLEYDTTKGGYFIAVRRFKDTGEIYAYQDEWENRK